MRLSRYIFWESASKVTIGLSFWTLKILPNFLCKMADSKIFSSVEFQNRFLGGGQGVGHMKILKISKETPKDVPETSYGPYSHYRFGGHGVDMGGGVGGPSHGYVP